MQGVPKVTQELLEYLEGICPDTSPRITDGDRDIWFNAGKAGLVKHLRGIFEDQNKNILEGN